jgi:hypothetical protein
MNNDTIKLFVGCAPNGEDAESMMVLEYTLKKHCSMPVDIVWMMHSNDPASFWYGWNSKFWATPFSGFRCGIPAYCNFQGEAIYMDSDMIIMADLAELWNNPWTSDTAIVQSKGRWRVCVCKFHNERCKTNKIWPSLDRIKNEEKLYTYVYGSIRNDPDLQQNIDPNWNNFDGENDEPLENIKILHYTDMSCQPHLKYAIARLEQSGRKHWFDGELRPHPRPDVQELFDRYYREALEAGYCVEDYDTNSNTEFAKRSNKGWRFDLVPK